MRWIVLLFCLSFMSCKKAQTPKAQIQINIDSLLDHQIQYLQTSTLELEKESRINSTINTASLKSNEVNWSNELEAFRSISTINKPTYYDQFKIETLPDPKSNMIIKSWVTEELPVKNLKVYFLKSSNQIKKIEVELTQTNFVFSSNRKLNINFSAFGPFPAIEQYEINGTQKFFWEEPQQYSLKGTIHLK